MWYTSALKNTATAADKLRNLSYINRNTHVVVNLQSSLKILLVNATGDEVAAVSTEAGEAGVWERDAGTRDVVEGAAAQEGRI